jgi:hypothetical protein
MRRVRLPCGKDPLASSCRRLYVGICRALMGPRHGRGAPPTKSSLLRKALAPDQTTSAGRCCASQKLAACATIKRRSGKLLRPQGYSRPRSIEMAIAAVAMGGHGGGRGHWPVPSGQRSCPQSRKRAFSPRILIYSGGIGPRPDGRKERGWMLGQRILSGCHGDDPPCTPAGLMQSGLPFALPVARHG